MHFKESIADRGVWIGPAIAADGFKYYEMICVYVGDGLVLSKEPQKIIDDIQWQFELKGGGAFKPTLYLGVTISKVQLEDGSYAWAMSPEDYTKNAVKVVEDLLASDNNGKEFQRKSATTPLPPDYKPKVDVSPELNADKASKCLQLTGIARWIVELGGIDIYHEISILSHHNIKPCREKIIWKHCIMCSPTYAI